MDGDQMVVEGYFAVFGETYSLWDGAGESIDPGAFESTLNGDIRALIDHETRLVLGRTGPGTLTLRVDGKGLWGRIIINPDDTDATNLYARVKRGDVSQCSFGFDILDEERSVNETTGEVHWLIKAVKLYEVSVVTFPAYESTSVTARKKEWETISRRRLEEWRDKMKRRLN